jgi:hypothetical protein
MDALIDGIDDSTYRAARARATLEGRSLGDLVTATLREYLTRTTGAESPAPLLDPPAAGNEHPAATHVDKVVFLYCI